MIEFFTFICIIPIFTVAADPNCNNNTIFPPHDDYSKPFTFSIPKDTSSIADRRPRRSATSLGTSIENEVKPDITSKTSQDDSSSAYVKVERVRRNAISLTIPTNLHTATPSLKGETSTMPPTALEQYKQLVLTKQPSLGALKEQAQLKEKLRLDYLDEFPWNETIVESYNELPLLYSNIYSINFLAAQVSSMNFQQIEDRLNENKNKYRSNPTISAQSLTHYIIGYNLSSQLPNRTMKPKMIKSVSKKKELNFEKGRNFINQIKDPLLKKFGELLIRHFLSHIKYSAGINSLESFKQPVWENIDFSKFTLFQLSNSLVLSEEFKNRLIQEEKIEIIKKRKEIAQYEKIPNLSQLIEDAAQSVIKPTESTEKN